MASLTVSRMFLALLPTKLASAAARCWVPWLGLEYLVARTIWSRLPRSSIHSPIHSSDSPCW